jgi:hypothetical protein
VNFNDGTPRPMRRSTTSIAGELAEPLRGDDYYDITVFGGYGDTLNIKAVTKIDDSTFSITLGTADFDRHDLIPFAMQSPRRSGITTPTSARRTQERLLAEGAHGTGPFMFAGDLSPAITTRSSEPELLGFG